MKRKTNKELKTMLKESLVIANEHANMHLDYQLNDGDIPSKDDINGLFDSLVNVHVEIPCQLGGKNFDLDQLLVDTYMMVRKSKDVDQSIPMQRHTIFKVRSRISLMIKAL